MGILEKAREMLGGNRNSYRNREPVPERAFRPSMGKRDGKNERPIMNADPTATAAINEEPPD